MVHTRMVPEMVDIVRINSINYEKEYEEFKIRSFCSAEFSENPTWLIKALASNIISVKRYENDIAVCVSNPISGDRQYLKEGDYIVCHPKRGIFGLTAKLYDVSGYSPDTSVECFINIEDLPWTS